MSEENVQRVEEGEEEERICKERKRKWRGASN